MNSVSKASDLNVKPDSAGTLRLAVVGCGAISESFYGPAIAALSMEDRLSVSCLVDPDPTRLAVLGTVFPTANQSANLDKLNSNDVDLAIVASPQRFHCQQAMRLLTYGIHVLCEKPLASNYLEAESMVKKAVEKQRYIAVGLFRRFFPVTQFIRDLVLGEDLGRPIRFFWSEGGVFDWPAATPSFFLKESSTGGVFADLGAHVLDLLLHWFGPVEEFHYQDDSMGGLEANALLQLRFDCGVSGRVRLSRDTPIPNSVSIEFERATLWFQGGSSSEVTIHWKNSDLVTQSTFYTKAHPGLPLPLAPGDPARTYTQSFMEQIRNFCRAIRGQDILQVPAAEALASISLIEQCYATRKLMPMPWLSADEQMAAEALMS
jgi:predicted dehydrogenase